MALATPAARKRVRKRKRRQASSSDDLASSSSSDSDSGGSPKKIAAVTTTSRQQPPLSSSSSSLSSESDSSDLDVAATKSTSVAAAGKKLSSRSPSPVSADIPSFPSSNSQPKERPRQFWLGSVADAFKDDLEQIRKEPNLTTSRLAILIDSLSAGAEVFTSSSDVDEMQLVLESST